MGFKDEMLCSKSHEYIVKQDDKYIIGLTDYAIDQLGDIVFLELPEVGDEFKKGDTFANIESVKAASEIYMPISGKIVEVNSELIDAPEKLNDDCYENGWLVKVETEAKEDEFSDLMSYENYKEELE
ncbi:TPA: glycine cleavage system protein H [Candidatus Gastranaerophilales bacterium HUM_6]|jgi:glycine cleavage system H protein|nr:glycine cleavage system protein GcvH [bacterium]MEE0494916.1 glycine cleavage system protein GcvH [Cyanobacteriota bacterium]CDE91545.1 glycine cleavage system H protein [Fusobacterium sp. CAG:815]DAA93111.1 MAG TPA: glycine cleavage system protein H [Candidatus Gastranaerophilales bacterium HUM_7]DAA93388.1 MAG TPA: glycine cleavage system protein H [Candidatus Gastranaerophilales bacterium HUM_6]DAB03976.1 MAG TPA: glycine cleavage system protein H [Candidatus Gastranaerophilales bacteriu